MKLSRRSTVIGGKIVERESREYCGFREELFPWLRDRVCWNEVVCVCMCVYSRSCIID